MLLIPYRYTSTRIWLTIFSGHHIGFHTRTAVSLNTRSHHTDKNESLFSLIYEEIQNGAVAKSYMTNGLLIYEEIFAHNNPFATAPL